MIILCWLKKIFKMKKNLSPLFIALLLVAIVYWVFYSMMPQSVSESKSANEFSTQNALNIIEKIAQKPHYIGSENHEVVKGYLISELQKLGLRASVQQGFTLTEDGNLTKPKNIIAKIKGTSNSKALLLLSHYDSAPHSYSHGASDDGSGVATILEGLRAFLTSKTKPKNDIIIVFSDAEEFGLNGASLFVNKHHWAENVGLAINFEARGSAGPSYMLMETNKGNAAMIKAFAKANPEYPVSNSLMYSIYKMLPNDTDLTVFREQGKIQGFNFAFIDNHFNYHTAQDDFAHVNPPTIAHQGTYLTALLQHFANADLSNLNTSDDEVYFNTPLWFVHYPFLLILPMLFFAVVIFIVLIFIGRKKNLLVFSEIGKGFLLFLASILSAGGISFLLWQLILMLYPQYKDILQGFTYNGHLYMYAFVFLSLFICFIIYQKFTTEKNIMSYYIAPLFFWILINGLIATYLKGAAFLIIPVFAGLSMLAYYVFKREINIYFNLIMAIVVLVIIAPFIAMFPIGLGLKILFVSAVLTALCFSLLLPIFDGFMNKKIWRTILLFISIGFFVDAHFNADYEEGKAKPNSLLYFIDADAHKAYWTTFDTNLDSWTKAYLGENPRNADELNKNTISSKYNSGFTFLADALMKDITSSRIEFLKDSTASNKRYLKIKITPQFNINRYDIFANENMVFHNFKSNGVASDKQVGSEYLRQDSKLLRYYIVDNIPLEIEFDIDVKTVLDMELKEASFSLLTHPAFSIAKRTKLMMPKPFVITDAILIKQKIKK
jgi:hypothetical protein